jgi:hypothetical protein
MITIFDFFLVQSENSTIHKMEKHIYGEKLLKVEVA